MAHDDFSSVHPASTRTIGMRRGAVSLARQSLAGLRVLIVLTVLLGVAYPVAVWGVGQIAFPWQANGSLLRADGSHATTREDLRGSADAADPASVQVVSAGGLSPVVGSALIGQTFVGDEWFHARPSAAGGGYDTLASAGSNLGPLSPELVATINDRRAEAALVDGVPASVVPPDAVTASASGLDPDISPEYAAEQVGRVARARGLDTATVAALVSEHTHGRDLGFLGEPRVNVLQLNIALGMMSS